MILRCYVIFKNPYRYYFDIMPVGIKVKEVMRTNVITGSPEETVFEIAKKMKNEDVGSVIIIKDKVPCGIVTREDIVIKVVAQSIDPRKVTAREIMNQPLISCKETDDILDVAMTMNKYGYERLPVVDDNNNLKGIISIREILAIAPGLIEVFKERLENRLEKEFLHYEEKEEESIEGECEICGNYSENLLKINDMWICSECAEREDLGEVRE